MSKPHTTVPIPRQPRHVEQGAHGIDVIAYKGGLVHAGVRSRRLAETPTFGHVMRDEVARFQRMRGIHGDGGIGPVTYDHLINWVGDYGRHLLQMIDAQHEAATVRQRYVQNCLWAAQTALWGYWTYAQVRPIPYGIPPRSVGPSHHAYTDCSGFTALMAKWTSGCPSPYPSYGWNGAGSTYTMEAELPRIESPLPGDLILYDNPGHVVVCIGYPWCIGFGAEPGPLKYDSRYRSYASFRRFIHD